MNERSRLGHEGEQEAIYHLMLRGYTLLEHNRRSSHYEIDIIAEYWGQIVFVEVKTRRNGDYIDPDTIVSYAQQQRLRRAATHYLARNRLTDRSFRFDLITLEGDAPPFVLHHYRNVFHTTPPNYPLP